MNLVVACMSCVGGDVLHKGGQKARGWDLAGAALKKTKTPFGGLVFIGC